MSEPDIRVVKVGGSLLNYGRLTAALDEWWAREHGPREVIVVGGGPLAEVVRQVDDQHGLNPVEAHWLAIRAMQLASHLLIARLGRGTICRSPAEISRLRGPPPALLDPVCFLRDEEPTCPGTRLPVGWHVTSDSIAARVAEVIGAGELVLLKSALTGAVTRSGAARQGYVDAWFPTAAEGVGTVRCVNLRDPALGERVLR